MSWWGWVTSLFPLVMILWLLAPSVPHRPAVSSRKPDYEKIAALERELFPLPPVPPPMQAFEQDTTCKPNPNFNPNGFGYYSKGAR